MSVDVRNIGSQIKDVVALSNVHLEEISRRIMLNKEGIDDEVISKWKSSIINISEESSKLLTSIDIAKNYYQTTEFNNLKSEEKKKLENISNSNSSSSSSSSSNFDPDHFNEIISNNINKKCQSALFSSANTDKLKDVLNIAKKAKKAGDIEVIERELNINDFTCPYTGKIMEEPMKSASCKHHISLQALNELTKNATTKKCPVAGCQGLWSKSTSQIDSEFEYRLKRFLLKQKDHDFNVSSSQSVANSVNIDDDNDDEGYTQL